MNTLLEHNVEPAPGLPQELPQDERALWQGRAEFSGLARSTFHVGKLALYFALLLGLRLSFKLGDGAGLTSALASSAGLFALAAIALGLLLLYAWLVARATMYTITNRRVVIRSGVAVPVTMNLPFSRIEAADLRRHADGSGDLSIRLEAGSRASYVLLWPLVKPWRLFRVRPVLRGVGNADEVAGILVEALASYAPTQAAKSGSQEKQQPQRQAGLRWGSYPAVPLAAAASLIVISLLAVAWIQLAGHNNLQPEPRDIVAEIDLFFEDRDDGSVVVVSADDGRTIETLEPGSNGFLRSTMRSVVRARRAVHAGSDTPFSLKLTGSGRLLLFDPATGREVDLWAFGKTNAQAFSRFLPAPEAGPLASAQYNDMPSDREITAVASNNQEIKP